MENRNKSLKASDNKTIWVKFGVIKDFIFIGKETMAFGYDCHITFINLVTGESSYFQVNMSNSTAEGIKLLAGHRTMNIFAFCESCSFPDILILSYPTFEQIGLLQDKVNSYISISFSEISLFVTLSSEPHYKFTVWNWRTSEKIAEKRSSIQICEQIIQCSLGRPLHVAQMGVKSHYLSVWDVYICCRHCILTQHQIQINFFPLLKECFWNSEGTLFVIDYEANAYFVDGRHALQRIISTTKSQIGVRRISDMYGNNIPKISFAWYNGGLLVAGPSRTLKHYQKDGDWRLVHTYVVEYPVLMLKTNKQDRAFAKMMTEEIVELIRVDGEMQLNIIEGAKSGIIFAVMVFPFGDFIAALYNNFVLNMLSCEGGKPISKLSLGYNICSMASNPEYPYVVCGTDDGVLLFISLSDIRHPNIIATLALCNCIIDHISCVDGGLIIVAANRAKGEFFILQGIPGQKLSVKGHLLLDHQVADYIVVPSKDCWRVFAIPVTSWKLIGGNKVIRYCILQDGTKTRREYEFEDKSLLYHTIQPTFGVRRDRNFFLVPYHSKDILEVEIKRGSTEAKIIKRIASGHLLQYFHLKLTRSLAITYCYDGFVYIRDHTFENFKAVALPHNRSVGGVRKAYVDPFLRYVVTIGDHSNIVCTRLCAPVMDLDLKDRYDKRMNDFNEFSMKRLALGKDFIMKGVTQMPWVLLEDNRQKMKEAQICGQEREAILEEFRSIQSTLQMLLTQNLEGPENERLDLLEFNLDYGLLMEKRRKVNEECAEVVKYNTALINANKKVFRWMKENLWDKAVVQSCALKSIFQKSQLTNFALLPYSLKETEIQWKEQQRKIQDFASTNDYFYPWANAAFNENDKSTIPTISETEESEEAETEVTDTDIALSGSTLPLYIEETKAHLPQIKHCTFLHTFNEAFLSKCDNIRLKVAFNKLFDNLVVQKDRDLTTIKERNERLRYIISEINYFSKNKLSINIIDPTWSPSEKPDKILTVEDSELTVTPYISPSEQALLDEKAAEAERLRLLLLADDFRERALMAMMNGVLEVRWEDELKKDVPLPKCMQEKAPEDFNEDDLRAVKDYEEKVALLMSERERYKKILVNEYAKIGNSIRETVKKFNQKVEDLIYTKTLYNSANKQSVLRICRNRVKEFNRLKLIKKEKEILISMDENADLIKSLHATIVSLKDNVAECKQSQEAAQARDKVLEKAYRRDFGDMPQVIQEQAAKLYKKRPRVSLKLITSTTVLMELARAVITREIGEHLTSECFDYFKGLEALDDVSNCPPIMDESIFLLLVKHRRSKIEFDIKMRCMQIDVTESEQTVQMFQKRLADKHERTVTLQQDLYQTRQDRLTLMHDVQLQIVLRKGFVEMATTGKISDYETAVMVPREELEFINEKILAAGHEKLKKIRQNTAFRRELMATEWRHKKLRMHIEDFEEQLIDIKAVKLTKEMQAYLKAKHKGHTGEMSSFEVEIELLSASYQNDIKDRKDKVEKIEKQIASYTEKNRILDKKIADVNVDYCLQKNKFDFELPARERQAFDSRFKSLLKRSELVHQIQTNHNEILVLQTELELLRLRTYPTFKYKLL